FRSGISGGTGGNCACTVPPSSMPPVIKITIANLLIAVMQLIVQILARLLDHLAFFKSPPEPIRRALKRLQENPVIFRVPPGQAGNNDVVSGFETAPGDPLTTESRCGCPFDRVPGDLPLFILDKNMNE